MSTIHIGKIEAGLKEIQNLGHDELEFKTRGIGITLRTLTNDEVETAQEYCRPLFEDAEDNFQMRYWLQATWVEMLSYSIVQINDMDFRGVEYVATDEVHPKSGNPIKIQKHIFMRRLINDWGPAMIEVCFKKFRDLTSESEKRASEGVSFDEKDPSEEIDMLQRKIDELSEQLKEDTDIKGPGETVPAAQSKSPQQSLPEDLDRDNLREMAFSSDQEQEEDDGYVYENRPEQQEAQPNSPQDPEGKVYVDADNIPLEGEDLEYAKAQDELWRQRQGTPETDEDAKALRDKRRRQPLNQTAPNVQEGPTQGSKQRSNPSSTVNAQKARREDSDIPVAEGFGNMEPEKLTRKAPVQENNQDDVNPRPRGNINPNYNPNQ